MTPTMSQASVRLNRRLPSDEKLSKKSLLIIKNSFARACARPLCVRGHARGPTSLTPSYFLQFSCTFIWLTDYLTIFDYSSACKWSIRNNCFCFFFSFSFALIILITATN
ncbi:hypothetical protein PYW08_006364 [Mythimna loreyi]|uniref:Uncharacterized protein n=1 Tax=Mythimna loreyi TaxID=667449 RepID=A0ACC2QQ18_9NEOP|nr:hypothetical protein PYW08_006364 [Mythimna loreyi]